MLRPVLVRVGQIIRKISLHLFRVFDLLRCWIFMKNPIGILELISKNIKFWNLLFLVLLACVGLMILFRGVIYNMCAIFLML